MQRTEDQQGDGDLSTELRRDHGGPRFASFVHDVRIHRRLETFRYQRTNVEKCNEACRGGILRILFFVLLLSHSFRLETTWIFDEIHSRNRYKEIYTLESFLLLKFNATPPETRLSIFVRSATKEKLLDAVHSTLVREPEFLSRKTLPREHFKVNSSKRSRFKTHLSIHRGYFSTHREKYKITQLALWSG